MKNYANPPRKKKIVLVADDDDDLLQLVKMQLQHAGFIVQLSPNGRGITSMAAETHPDIILLDISMPIMNGWQFLDEYNRRKIDPVGKSAIFILSSSVYSDDMNRARLYSQVKSFICKPLNVEKIRELFRAEEAVQG